MPAAGLLPIQFNQTLHIFSLPLPDGFSPGV
jgi:hypothetical protein